MLHPSNLRLNAALLQPEESMNLAERAAVEDEQPYLDVIHDVSKSRCPALNSGYLLISCLV